MKKESLKRQASNFFSLCITLLFTLNLQAQLAPGYYFVQLTDKVGTPYSVSQPEAFLSAKAIQRRLNQGISITTNDLPINPDYIDSIEQSGNIRIHHKLKWANGLVIESYDTAALESLKQFAFVDSTQSILSHANSEGKRSTRSTSNKFNELPVDTAIFGAASGQIEQLSLQYLHQDGFNGEDMLIAVMDAGFSQIDTFSALSHLYQNGQIQATYDFVQNQPYLDYFWSRHGTWVMGTLAANDSGSLMGTAPNADYLLLRTENAFTEYVLEEYHWAAAAEYADSIGADILTTSLGYTTFDDSLQDHSYSDMDGKTTFITRMANRAAGKGMLVINSAGNSGGSLWRYISAPADGDSVLAIGAVGVNDTIAGFSSRGPNSAGLLKPNVMACGFFAASVGYDFPVEFINGTSFSCPILAGAAACLWQANPNLTNMEIMHLIEESADRFNNPDNDYGNGIPNFAHAYWVATGIDDVAENKSTVSTVIYPNPAQTEVWINNQKNTSAEIYSLSGSVIKNQVVGVGEAVQLDGIPAGVYLLKIENDVHRLIIQP